MSLGLIETLTQVIPEHLKDEVARELANGWRLEEIKARHAAQQLGKLNRDVAHKSVKGLGRLVARIPSQAFHYWNKKDGMTGCWDDKAFMNEFLRDNPECKVTNQEIKTVVIGGAKGLLDYNGKPI